MSSNVIVLNSIDRIKEDTTFDYTFNFGDKRNDRRGVLYKSVNNVTGFHIEYIVIPNLFINVHDVHAIKQLGMLPLNNEELNRSNFSFPKLSDLKYINVNIDELNGNVSGSSNKKSSAMFIIDNIVPKSSTSALVNNYYLDASEIKVHKRTIYNGIGETIIDEPHNYIILKNVSQEPTFYKTNLLSSINLKFYKPNGEQIELMNDKLTISSISSTHVRPFINDLRLSDGTPDVSSGSTVLDASVTDFETDSPYLREGLFLGGVFNLLSNPMNSFIKQFYDSVWADTSDPFTPGGGTYYRCNFNRTLVNSLPGHPPRVWFDGELEFESRVLEITFNEYFSSEEYKIGDTIHFKDIDYEASDFNYSDLTKFLSREEGHTIVGLRRPSWNNTTLYNIIEILPKTTRDLTSGFEEVDYFLLQELYNASDLSVKATVDQNVEAINKSRQLSGYVLNNDLQNLVSINIKNN